MSKYDFDKYIKKSNDKKDNDSSYQQSDSSRVDFAGDPCIADSYGAYSALNCLDNCNGAACGNVGNSLSGASCNSLQGVNCEATKCRYHHPGGQCSAKSITVEAPDADNKSDTFCNSFTPNSGH